MADEVVDKIYNMKDAFDGLQDSVSALESVTKKMRHSTMWNVVSRMSSGIFPDFWALQNKFRGAAIFINEQLAKGNKQSKKMYESIEKMSKMKEMSDAMDMFKDGLFGGEDFSKRTKKDLQGLTKTLEKHFKDFKGIEHYLFGDKFDETKKAHLVRLLEVTKGTLSGQYQKIQSQKDIAEARIQEMEDFDEYVKSRGLKKGDRTISPSMENPDSPFFLLRMKVLRLQFKANTMWTKIKSFDYMNAIKGAGIFFFKALLAFSAIVLGLFMLKKSFDLLKEPLGEAFESIKEQVMWVLGGIFNTLSDLGSAFVLLYDGFANGEFFTVIDALLQIFAGVFKLGLQVLGGIIWLGVSSIVIVLGELLEHAVSSSTNFYNTVTGILLAVGVVAGYLVFIGSTIAALPYMIVAGIAGVIMLGIKSIMGFSTGGIVNSDMQIVGERGAELVSLPRGSRVHSNADSKRMLGGSGGNTINVHVNGRVGASDAEIRDIANKVAREINLRMSRTGSGVNNF